MSFYTKGSLTTVFINFDSKLSTNQLILNQLVLILSLSSESIFFSYTRYILSQAKPQCGLSTADINQF